MPYRIEKQSGPRPWKIVKADTGEVVGSSASRQLAGMSIGYREEAERKKAARGRRGTNALAAAARS